MTSQSSIIKKQAGFMPLFGFTAKQFWTTILLFTIILFFTLPVPILMIISGREAVTDVEILRLKEDITEEWVSAVRYAAVIIMSLFAVIVSCSRFKYLKNKVSVDFYHSLPVKRGQLFLTQLAVSALSLAIPYVFNILFTMAVLASNGFITSVLIVDTLIMSAEVFIYSAFFYSISTLVGMISGLTAVHLTLSAVAIFIVPAVYITVLGFVDIFCENMWFGFYANQALFEKLSPALRFVFNPEPLFVHEALIMLLASVGLLFGAYAVYTRRKSERSGTPVVFAPLGEIIKYILVFLGTLLGGLLFYYIMDSFFWTVFGMVCGMVLVFMLTNTILNKTARAMFKGWKGLCVFAVCTAAVFTMMMTNAFGINSRIPSPANTSRVVINFEDGISDLEFRDRDVIEAIHTLYTDGKWTNDIRDNPKFYTDYTYIEVVFYPKVGIPVAKTVRIYNKNDFTDEYRIILDSDEFKKQYVNGIAALGDSDGYMNIMLRQYLASDKGVMLSAMRGSHHWDYKEEEMSLSSVTAKVLGLDLLTEANTKCGFDFFQQQMIGCLYAYRYNDYTFYDGASFFPIYGSMDALVDHYIDKGILSYTPEEYIGHLTNAINEITVMKYDENGNENTMTVRNKAQIREILLASVSPNGHSSGDGFIFSETKYTARYEINVSDDYMVYTTEDGKEQVITGENVKEEGIYIHSEPVSLKFRLGKIPQFVIDKLG